MSYSYVFTNKPLSKEFEDSSENEKLLNGHKMTFVSDHGPVAWGRQWFVGKDELSKDGPQYTSSGRRRREKDED